MAVSGVSYSNQIKALKVGPLDGKSLAPNFDSLRDPNYWVDLDNGLPYIKNGMIFSTEDGHIYQLLDRSNYTLSSAWKEVGVGGTGGSTEIDDAHIKELINEEGFDLTKVLFGEMINHTDKSITHGLLSLINDYSIVQKSHIYELNTSRVELDKDSAYGANGRYIDLDKLYIFPLTTNIYDLNSVCKTEYHILVSGVGGTKTIQIDLTTSAIYSNTNLNQLLNSDINDKYGPDNYNLEIQHIDIRRGAPFYITKVKENNISWVEL